MLATLVPPGMVILNYVAWIIGIPVTAFLGARHYRKYKGSYDTTVRSTIGWSITCYLLAMFVVLFLTGAVSDIGGMRQKVHAEPYETVRIAAMQDNSGVSGQYSHFFLFGSGYLTGEIHYSYYIEQQSGSLIPITKSEKDVELLPSKDASPSVTRYRSAFDNPKLNYWFFPPDTEEKPWRETIVVPPDAIKRDYSSDLK